MRHDSLIPLLFLIPAVGCGREVATAIPDSSALAAPESSTAVDPLVVPIMSLQIFPDLVVLPRSHMQGFTAGITAPDGTTIPISSDWEADPVIGTVSPLSSSTTTLTTASALPPGQTEVHGLVQASADGLDDAGAYVVVVDEGEPIGTDHYKACVKFTSGGKVVKTKAKEQCPHKWAKVIEVRFPVGMGARADYKDRSTDVPGEAAPPFAGRLVVTIDHSTGRVTNALWRGANGGGAQALGGAVDKTQVTLSFPAGSTAEIETVNWTGVDLDVGKQSVSGDIAIPDHKVQGKRQPINDIHIFTEKH